MFIRFAIVTLASSQSIFRRWFVSTIEQLYLNTNDRSLISLILISQYISLYYVFVKPALFRTVNKTLLKVVKVSWNKCQNAVVFIFRDLPLLVCERRANMKQDCCWEDLNMSVDFGSCVRVIGLGAFLCICLHKSSIDWIFMLLETCIKKERCLSLLYFWKIWMTF